jgi:CDP-diacylglycerol--serine O-phosphatidyltransferase
MRLKKEVVIVQTPEEPLKTRGIYLLPNLFTITALFAGFYAIVVAMEGRFDNAAIAIFVAMILDGLDGRIARFTQTQTAFGAQLDSLSDMVSFGVAPALVVFIYGLLHIGKIGWLAAFIFTVCAALRLARFNLIGKVDRRYFKGLPSPPAAATIASMVWLGFDFEWRGVGFNIFAAIVTIIIGLLMVSNFPYRSFKDFDIRGKVPFVVILMIVFFYVIISIEPPLILFAIAIVYALSGPVLALWNFQKHRRFNKRNKIKDIHP